MPQMAPISWLSLFFMFIFIFYLFNVKNYFMYTPIMPKSNFNQKKINFSWKW